MLSHLLQLQFSIVILGFASCFLISNNVQSEVKQSLANLRSSADAFALLFDEDSETTSFRRVIRSRRAGEFRMCGTRLTDMITVVCTGCTRPMETIKEDRGDMDDSSDSRLFFCAESLVWSRKSSHYNYIQTRNESPRWNGNALELSNMRDGWVRSRPVY